MVQINRPSSYYDLRHHPIPLQSVCICFILLLLSIYFISFHLLQQNNQPQQKIIFDGQEKKQNSNHETEKLSDVLQDHIDPSIQKEKIRKNTNYYGPPTSCLYTSIQDLTPQERYPKKGQRHMVDPPSDNKITLVCCETTAGSLSIAVHSSWAPLGSERFLELVKIGYFTTRIALMRCVKNFLCQFGIAGEPTINKQYHDNNILDDPNWLPEGPAHRINAEGTKRYAKGYVAYAGGGPNTRSNQFIIALHENPFLGGGSPWEVPFGEVVGEDSFRVLDSIFTGYGEKGPSQALLAREGSSAKVEAEFPELDYITSCTILDEIAL